MKAIFKMHVDCGRQGDLQGTFVAEKEDVENLIKSETIVYFGEVLGKHSEVFGSIEASEITMVSEDPATVEMFETSKLSSGYNPFDYDTNEDLEDSNVLSVVREWAKEQESVSAAG